LKPNFIAPKPVTQPAQTHPQLIIAVARLVKDLGARPIVADSPAWGTIHACARALELVEPLRQLGVPLQSLKQPRTCRINDTTTVGIGRLALEADTIVNLPKLKAHQQMVATIAVKNMFGCVTGKKKPYWHFARGHSMDRFADFLMDLYRYMPATVTLIDGIVAMEGKGPIQGTAKTLGWLVGSTDAIACETICATLMGLSPSDLPILRAARRADYGGWNLDAIEVRGDADSLSPCPDFAIPDLIPVRFSLPRICKSIVQGAYTNLVKRERKRA
jgi:uncharacterized protein (DUF362 family)